MNYRKSYRKRTVSPDGKVVIESSGYVEITAESHSESSGGSSSRVSSHTSSTSVSSSSIFSSTDTSDWQGADD